MVDFGSTDRIYIVAGNFFKMLLSGHTQLFRSTHVSEQCCLFLLSCCVQDDLKSSVANLAIFPLNVAVFCVG